MAIRKNSFVQLREDVIPRNWTGYVIMTAADRQAWYDQQRAEGCDPIGEDGESRLAPTSSAYALKAGRRYLTIRARCRVTINYYDRTGMIQLLDPSTGVTFYARRDYWVEAT
jgi:hypothetical protein